MRRILFAVLLFCTLITPEVLYAQDTGWCGYALIQGLPLLANQLAPFEAITPDESANINPAWLFQYRFSLDHSEVIIEGCWKANLTRDLVVTLLSQTIQYDAKAMAPQLQQIVQQAVADGSQPTIDDVIRLYVDQALVFSLFAQGQSRDVQAAAVRDFLAKNSPDWNPPDDH